MVKNISNLNDAILVFFYRILVISTIILPTGSIYGFNYKIVLVAMCALIGYKSILLNSFGGPFICLLFITFITIISSSVGYINGVNSINIITQDVAILSALSIFYIGYCLIRTSNYSIKKFFVDIVNATVILGIIKIILCSLEIFKTVNVNYFRKLIDNIFGFQFITLDTGSFSRIHLPGDYLIPACLIINSFILIDTRILKTVRTLLLIVSCVISYSRIIYAYTACILILIFLFQLSKQRKTWWFLISKLTYLLPLTFIAIYIYQFFRERYTGQYANISDSLRHEMHVALISNISKYPILGFGLGSSVSSIIRSETMPWYYELQWEALCMQIGIPFVITLLLLLVIPFLLRFISGNNLTRLFVISYFLWIISNALNGFLFTSVSGIIFLIYYAQVFPKMQSVKI